MRIYQLHFQYKNGTTDMKAQKEIYCHDELRKFTKETVKEYPLPDDAIWLACWEGSEYFVGQARKEQSHE